MKINTTARWLLWGVIVLVLLVLFQFSRNAGVFLSREGTPESRGLETTSPHLETGQWEKALNDLFPLLDQGVEDPNVKDNIARCYRELGISAFKEQRYEDALVSFEEGLRYVEDDPGLQLSLAATCLTISDYDRAEEAYKRVLGMAPNNLQALKELGELYYLKNDPENAQILWRRAAALDPNDALLEKRLSALQKQLSAVENFNVDENIHFTITYDGASMPRLEYSVLEIMEDAYYEIGGRLHLYPKRQISVTLMTEAAFFDITGVPSWTSGLYEGQIKIPVAGADPEDLKEVLYHEFVHAVLFDQIGKRCPWWLNEGLAQHLSKADDRLPDLPGVDAQDASLRNAVRLSEYGGVMKMDRKDAARAYAFALSAVRYFVGTYGEANLQRVIESMAAGESFETSFWIATGYSFEEFENDWRQYEYGM